MCSQVLHHLLHAKLLVSGAAVAFELRPTAMIGVFSLLPESKSTNFLCDGEGVVQRSVFLCVRTEGVRAMHERGRETKKRHENHSVTG